MFLRLRTWVGRSRGPFGPGVLGTVVALAAASAWGRPGALEPLEVQLVCDTGAVQPGQPLWVGLHFRMPDHWHIYWTNPGDAGDPPRVRWNLPAGFQAGAIQWPAPERLGSGSVVEYGYQDEVLLPVEIQTTGTALAPGGTVTLSASVSWLVCKDLCLPGKADLTLTLPVRMAPGPVSASHGLFLKANARLPKPMPAGWLAEATSGPDVFVLTLQGAGPGQASFFPLEADQIDPAAPQAATAVPGGVRLTLRRSERLTRTPARLEGVLELGSGQVYAVSAPVRPAP